MKIKENVTIYQCEYCKKKMVVKNAMVKHEVNCYSNPDNQRACSGCVFVKEIEVEYTVSFGGPNGDYEQERQVKGFKCTKLEQIMYPYKAEKHRLPDKYPETFEGQVPMPKVCELHSFSIYDF